MNHYDPRCPDPRELWYKAPEQLPQRSYANWYAAVVVLAILAVTAAALLMEGR